ncbi:MAG: ferredoxin family protein [Desulfovibrio sp.]|nr:ferredoxin family protein [Desulfovibrio sp.]
MKITIDSRYCKGCGLCVAVCKTHALTQGNERNEAGYMPPHAEKESCVGCGACWIICPEMALTVEEDR